MYLFFWQISEVLQDIIINKQEAFIEDLKHGYSQVVIILIWSLSLNVCFFVSIAVVEFNVKDYICNKYSNFKKRIETWLRKF